MFTDLEVWPTTASIKQQGLEFNDLHLYSVLCASVLLFQFTDMLHSNFTSICLSIDWRCIYYLIYIVLLRTTRKRQRLHMAGNAEGCFRAYQGGRYIQGTYKVLTRYIQGTYKAHTRYIQGTYKVHTRRIQGAYKVHRRHIQGTYKAHKRYIQGTYKVHTRYIQGTYKVHTRLRK